MPSFSQRGSRLPLWPEKKPWQYWGKKSSSGGRKPFKAKCERTVSNSASLWMILPSAGWRGPANTDSSSSRSGARLNRMTGILRAHAEARAFPRVVMVVSRAHIGPSSTVPPAAYRPRRDRDKNANRKEKTQGPLPHLQRSVAEWSRAYRGVAGCRV